MTAHPTHHRFRSLVITDRLSSVTRRGAPLACGLLLGTFTAEAHHSISGMYDTRRDVRVEGVVTQFEFVNPHAFITLDVPGPSGAPQRWRVELDDRGDWLLSLER